MHKAGTWLNTYGLFLLVNAHFSIPSLLLKLLSLLSTISLLCLFASALLISLLRFPFSLCHVPVPMSLLFSLSFACWFPSRPLHLLFSYSLSCFIWLLRIIISPLFLFSFLCSSEQELALHIFLEIPEMDHLPVRFPPGNMCQGRKVPRRWHFGVWCSINS